MKRCSFFLYLLASLSPITAQPILLKTADLVVAIDPSGQLAALTRQSTGKNYLATGQSAPLLRIQSGDIWDEPAQANWDNDKGILTLTYSKVDISAGIRVVQHATHLTFELLRWSNETQIDAITWGPYPISIGQTVGEVIGVVRDGEFAIGLQALNPKTLGGILRNEEGSENTRGSVAVPQSYGSSLQAYSLDRSRNRIMAVWGGGQYPEMPVKAIPGETTLGSRIAIFGCTDAEALSHIGAIELAEGLPHPLIKGVWHKLSPETGRPYLIADFNENIIDAMLDYTEKAGLKSLYHEGPFQSWGHFILDPERFPNGNAGMKACVEKAASRGMRIGVHTLTNFINTNDPYVTPVPDQRLSATGFSLLTAEITAGDTEIGVGSGQYFLQLGPSTLHAVRIGEEILRFREVSAGPPWRLLDCQRGAFGTKAGNHARADTAYMLMDYPYYTLFPDFNLQQEIAGRLGRFFAETGVSQMDFDGHEGCQASGQGDYGMQAFADKVYRETPHTLVNGTSRSSHYYWHICHYWNWGEPWYGGFRESQGDYRLENQPLLERNYMPNMLGWFLLSPTTSTADIEWMMARAAGFRAGFALVARYESLLKNPNSAELLELVRLWLEANEKSIFSDGQLARLKDPENDFHLEKQPHEWRLYPYTKHHFDHRRKMLQPGQPAFSEWNWSNGHGEQPLKFTLMIDGKDGIVIDPWIEWDGYHLIELDGEFETGYSIVCDGITLKLYDNKGSFKREIPLRQAIPRLENGMHRIRLDGKFPNDADIILRLVIRTMGSPEIIRE